MCTLTTFNVVVDEVVRPRGQARLLYNSKVVQDIP